MRTLAAATAALVCATSVAHAQTARSVTDSYEDLLKAAQTISALGPDLFGEETNLQDGATAFRAIDVSLKLNSGLPMMIGRRLGINARDYDRYSDAVRDGDLFGNWQLDVPMMRGVFDQRTGWISSMPNGAQRCSVSGAGLMAPPTRQSIFKNYNYYEASQYWNGNQISIPGEGTEPLLYLPASEPRPSDGRTYYGTTKSQWRVACVPALQNGAGEGFLVALPDGTRYTFDWVSSRRVSAIKETACNNYGCPTGIGLERAEVFLAATRIEDRFGNWVAYHYDAAAPRRLLSITSNEGASIQLAYNAAGKISTVSAHGRTWSYSYLDDGNPTLSAVTQPDGSQWTFAYDNIYQVAKSDSGLLWRDCEPPVTDQNAPPPAGQMLTITHPSGASGTFKFRKIVHGMVNAPGTCYDPDPDRFNDEQVSPTPMAYRIASLYAKTITGPSLTPRTWSYLYTPSWAWANDCTPTSCPVDSASQTQVTEPDGHVRRYRFGNNYQTNAGQLLEESIEAGGVVARRTVSSYVQTASGQPFPDGFGLDPQRYTNHFVTEKVRPVRSTAIVQDGTTFTSYIQTYDAFARPLRVTQSSSLPTSKTEDTTYHDNLSYWVLGSPASQSNLETGLVLSHTDYDAMARPWRTYQYGKLQQTMTYYPDGTLASVGDGNGNTTSYAAWKRGIPGQIQFPPTAESPSGSAKTAAIDDLGLITAVTDENGFATGYGYDAAGRIASVTYPAGDNVAWLPSLFEMRRIGATEWRPPGIEAGQWRQYSGRGSYAKFTYFDGLLRPILVQEYDVADAAGTLRAVSTSYDLGDKVSFQSYPSASLSPPASGTRTTYDALERQVRVEQDSELGALVTTTEYLPGLQTRVTNPRGYATTTSFLAWHEPTYELPLLTTAPEGKIIEVVRQPQLGRTLELRQRNLSGSLQRVRSYVYDSAGQLCKTIEPEIGATVFHYDGAGNPVWTASGLRGGTFASTATCSDSEADGSGRKVTRVLDARNRTTLVSFPDGRGNQSWQYTKDGLPSVMTAYNDGASSGAVTTSYVYNKRRLATAETVQQPGWYSWTLSSVYNDLGHVQAQQYPTGLSIDYAPNALGQATRAGSYATLASYFPNGALRQVTYGNGLVQTMTQNARQLPARVTTGAAMDLGYTYDASANLASIWDYARDTGNGHYARTLTYDGLDRLLTASSCSFGGDCTHRFGYDALDNLASWRLAGVKDYASYLYDAQTARLSSVHDSAGVSLVNLSYDAQGNVVQKNGQAFDFDFGNRLRAAVGLESYRYDAHGRRVQTQRPLGEQTLWMYGKEGRLMSSWDGPTNQKTHEHVYLAGSLIAKISHDWPSNTIVATRYQHTDALGSPVATTDGSGAVIERFAYEPLGSILDKPSFSGVGFTGHVMDGATGLTYMQQRYYDSSLGRFLSVDPVVPDTKSGANFNRYWYGNGNPYKYVDPDGRSGVNLHNRSEPVLYNAGNADMGEWWLLAGHGAVGGGDYEDRSLGLRLDMDASQLTTTMRHHGLRPAQPVFSLMCFFGATNANGVNLAQQLANDNFSAVYGANGYAYHVRKGDFTTVTVWSERGGKGKQGAFQLFLPRQGGPVRSGAIQSIKINMKTGKVTVNFADRAAGSRIRRSWTFNFKKKP